MQLISSKSKVTEAESLMCDECHRKTYKGSIGIFIVENKTIAPGKRKMRGFVCLSCWGDKELDEDLSGKKKRYYWKEKLNAEISSYLAGELKFEDP